MTAWAPGMRVRINGGDIGTIDTAEHHGVHVNNAVLGGMWWTCLYRYDELELVCRTCSQDPKDKCLFGPGPCRI